MFSCPCYSFVVQLIIHSFVHPIIQLFHSCTGRANLQVKHLTKIDSFDISLIQQISFILPSIVFIHSSFTNLFTFLVCPCMCLLKHLIITLLTLLRFTHSANFSLFYSFAQLFIHSFTPPIICVFVLVHVCVATCQNPLTLSLSNIFRSIHSLVHFFILMYVHNLEKSFFFRTINKESFFLTFILVWFPFIHSPIIFINSFAITHACTCF